MRATIRGESRLRIVGGGRQKAVFSALKELPAEDFMPVEGQPYYMYQFDRQADGTSSNWYDYNNIVVHNPDRDAFNARIYLQCLRKASFFTACHDQQCAWNILCENNYICCVENFGRIFASYEYDPAHASDRLDYTRHLRERDTHIVKSVAALKKIPEAKNIWDSAGCKS